MMSGKPNNTAEVAELVRSHPRVSVRGGGTKRGLGECADTQVLEMTGLSGLTEYQASEFTFTARAGTRISEVNAALEEQGQYLPFDPHWVAAGATLGGTVAAGIPGPGRFRFGGLRDFLLGIEFVDGSGRVVRSGGRVVKNAAGFDLSKFMVGSLGSFGVLTEVTFKVFPKPKHSATLKISCGGVEEAVERIVSVTKGRVEAEAVEYAAETQEIYLRLGAPPVALDSMCEELDRAWTGDVTRLPEEESKPFWTSLREMKWSEEADCLVKVPVTPSGIVALEKGAAALGGCRNHYSSGGVVAWMTFDRGALEAVDALLKAQNLRGMLLASGLEGQCWLGRRADDAIITAVKYALDPEGRFPIF